MDNNKRVYLIIGVITITMLVMGVTTAWFTWHSTTNTDVAFNVEGLDITYTGDENVLNKKLYPTATMTNTDNVIHKFSLVTTSNIDIYTKISLDIIKLDDNLKDVSFRWNLYKEDTSIASGNFSNATVGSDVLLTQTMITTTSTNYTLYIWIDGENYSNPIAMGGKDFNFKLKLEAGQQVYATPEECFNFDETTGKINYYSCKAGNRNNLPTITNVIIPSEINGVTVTSIGEHAFLLAKLDSVTIPDSVTTIEYGAFKDGNLTSITIPESVTSIGTSLLSGSKNLTNITVSSNNKVYDSRDNSNAIIETSSNKLIQGCKNTVIPNTVTEIGATAFWSHNLTSVTIPDNVTTIGDSAFLNNSLTNVTIPESVTTIGKAILGKNPNLTSITVSLNNKVYDSRDNSNAIIETSSNKLIQGCKNTVIPNTVTTIGYSAFYGNNLTNVTIPNSVTTIGENAFMYNSLTSIIIPDSVTEIGNYAFLSNQNSNPNLTTIYNLSGKSFNWKKIITYSSGTAFVSGTVTTSDGRTITITTRE